MENRNEMMESEPMHAFAKNEPHQLYFLEDKLGVERIEIQAAVTAVGSEAEKVERYLKDKIGLQ